MDDLFSSETFLSKALLISPDLQDGLSLCFWDIAINTTTDLTWSTRWIVFALLRHSYQHHCWSHLFYKMNFHCTSETFLSTPLLISSDLQDGLSLYFWDIHINTTTDLTWSTIWTIFVLLRHFYQHHYWSDLIYKMNCLCSETFLSTPLLISPVLQDGLSLFFWDIHINTTTDLTWSTIWTVFVLLRHFYQHTTDLTWSTRWTVFVLLRHSYQPHYWSHLIYKMDCVCISEAFLSTPLLISSELQDKFSLYFWDIPINTTTHLTWSTRWTVFVLLRHSYQQHYWISLDLDGRFVFFWDIPINTTTDLTWSTRLTVFVLLRHIESNTGEYKIEKSPTP